MKYFSKTSLVASAALIILLPLLVAMRIVGASGTATMYLAPANTTVAVGSTLKVDIHEDSGADNINAARANLTYSSNLTFLGIDNNDNFLVVANNTGGGGVVNISRGVTLVSTGGPGKVSGDNVVASVRFSVNAGGGGRIDFDNSSVVVRSSDNRGETMTYTGGNYNFTDGAFLNLSPVNQTVTKGQSFDVGVYENSNSDPVNGVQANLSYPTNLLNFVSITSNNVTWPLVAQNSGGNGTVNIARGTCAGCAAVTGNNLVATVKFTATNAGTAPVGITGALTRSTDNSVQPSTNTGGVYTINNPPSSGGTAKSGGGKVTNVTPPVSVTTSPGPQTSPVSTPLDTTSPTISNIKVTNLTTKSATITWTTSEPATSEVDYGVSTKLVLSKLDSKLTRSHSISFNSKELIAHTTYHFVVKSADAAGNKSASKDMTFKTASSSLNTTKIGLISAAVVAAGVLVWLVATGFGAFKGRGGDGSGHGSYTEPKPLIVAGGPATTAPAPVVKPQLQTPPPTQTQTDQKPKTIIKGENPQTPGEVITPKSSSSNGSKSPK